MIGVSGAGNAEYYGDAGACARGPKSEARSASEYHLRGVEHGEPVGTWYGRGLAAVGLSEGQDVEDKTLTTLLDDLEHPETGEPLGKRPYRYASAKERGEKVAAAHPEATPEELATMRLAAQRQSRHAKHGWDITPSVPKSVSALHAALEREGRQAEADAVMAAVKTGIAKTLDLAMRDLAFTRDQSGAPNVAGRTTSRYVHNPNWIIAVFIHRTSRNQDPQLHGHAVVINRVQDPVTGRWKTLHSPALTKNKHMLDAVFTRTVEGEVTRATGFTFATERTGDTVAREVRGVDRDVRDFFSTRSREIDVGAEKLIAEYRETYGRDPSPWMRYQINQHVTLDTRQAKPDVAPTREEDLARWDAALGRRIRGAFATVLAQADEHRVTDRTEVDDGLGFDPGLVIEQAVADLDESKSTFTRTNLYYAIANRLPDDMSHLSPDELIETLDGLTDEAEHIHGVVSLVPPSIVDPPDELRDERGRYIFDAPLTERFTTRTNLAREDSLIARLDQVGGRRVDEATAQAVLEDHELGDDQHRTAMGILTSDRRVHVVVGPAGAGKSRLMGALDSADRDLYGQGIVGLTTAENAAQVLRAEGVSKAFNLAAFLGYHERAAAGRATEREHQRFHVPVGATVVFDEAGTISTRDYYEAMAVADRIGLGKLILIGDPEQADAVENAGVFAMLIEHGDPHHLEEVRRFRHEWERDASTRLREGDAQALTEYDARGRLHEGSDEEIRRAAVENWLADFRTGRDSAILTATAEQGRRVSSMARERLIEHGLVDREGTELRGGVVAGRGDRVQTRFNNRKLGVVNRETWTVRELRADGAMTVVDAGGRERYLSPAYVRSHLDLAYASTVDAAQGRTLDTGHLLTDENMGRSKLYPGSSRGREANHIYVRTEEGETALGKLADMVEFDDHSPAARTVIREEQDRAENLGNIGSAWQLLVTEDRAAEHRAMIVDELSPDDARAVLEDRASAGLYRLFHQAEAQGRDPRADLRAVAAAGPLRTARTPAQALHGRLTKYAEQVPMAPRAKATTYLGRTPGGDDPKRVHARELAEQMDQRTTVLGEKAADEQPSWTTRLGPVPDDPTERAAWVHRAGHVAAHREMYGHTDEDDAIGTRPSKVEPERWWSWNRAADALGVDEAQRDLEAQTDGALRNRIDAWRREQEWLPPNVDDRLRTAHQAADEARRQAAERAADVAAQERLTRAQERTERLETIAAARKASMEETRKTREEAKAAQAEWERRHPAEHRDDEAPAPEPTPEQERAQPEPAVEREPAREPEDDDARDLSRANAAMAELARRREARQAEKADRRTNSAERDTPMAHDDALETDR